METLADLAPERGPDPAKVKADLAGYLKRRGMGDVEAERIVQATLDRQASLPKWQQTVAMLYSIAEWLRQKSQPEAQ